MLSPKNLSVAICLFAAPALARQSDSDRLLQVEANAYRANFESFEFVTCRYTITSGFADSLDDAIAKRLKPDSSKATAAYFKDGNVSKFQIEEDAKTKALLDNPPTPGKLTKLGGMNAGPIVPFMTKSCLINQYDGLAYNPRVRSANVYDGQGTRAKSIDAGFILAPLEVNCTYDFAGLVDQTIRKEIKCQAGPGKDNQLQSTFTLARDPVVTYTTHSRRGSVPTRIEMRYAEGVDGVLVVVVPDIIPCTNRRWFPKRIVTFVKENPAQTPCLVHDYQVIDFDADKRPPREALTIELPAGTVVCQLTDPQKLFATRQLERVGADDLARIRQLTEGVPKTPLMDTAIVLPPDRSWLWYLLAGIVAALAVGYSGRRYLRARG